MTTRVVGGGWSGLAAAVTLCQHRHPVHLLEAAKQLGGRARTVSWQPAPIDNGQHLLIGAYQHTLTLLQQLGLDLDQAFQRQPFELCLYARHAPPLYLSARHRWLPWPLSVAWNLIRHSGMDTLRQLARIQHAVPKMLSAKDMTVSAWLHGCQQSPVIIRQLWQPLCLATLNTPVEQASAHVFATVLRDSLGQGKKAAELFIPRHTLGELLPQAAQRYLAQQGSRISLQSRVKALLVEQNRITGVQLQSGKILRADRLILATSPAQTVKLLAPYQKLPSPVEYPITTVYLQYPATISLGAAMLGMTDTLSQWVFDRRDHCAGLLAVVISGPGQHMAFSRQQLIDTVSQELHAFFPHIPAQAKQAYVIREKRATFAATVEGQQQRPVMKTAINGLWLAGDYVANTYPATLESAVINGIRCAHQVLAS